MYVTYNNLFKLLIDKGSPRPSRRSKAALSA